MGFYYNPITGKVEKVTASQKKAVDQYEWQQGFKQILQNPTLPLAIAAAATFGVAGLKLRDWIISLRISEKVEEFVDETTEKVKDIVVDPFTIDQTEQTRFTSDLMACLNKYSSYKDNILKKALFGPLVTTCMIRKGWTSEIIGTALAKYI